MMRQRSARILIAAFAGDAEAEPRRAAAPRWRSRAGAWWPRRTARSAATWHFRGSIVEDAWRIARLSASRRSRWRPDRAAARHRQRAGPREGIAGLPRTGETLDLRARRSRPTTRASATSVAAAAPFESRSMRGRISWRCACTRSAPTRRHGPLSCGVRSTRLSHAALQAHHRI